MQKRRRRKPLPPRKNKLLEILKRGFVWVVLFAGMTLAWKLSTSIDIGSYEAENGRILCAHQCMERGFDTTYCYDRCWSQQNKVNPTPYPEPGCMQNCLRSGREETMCEKACTY